MSSSFDPFEGCTPETHKADWEWLTEHFRPAQLDENYHWVSEPERALEFAEIYFSHPELRGWRRHYGAEILVDAAIAWIDPDHDDIVPASEEQAVSLLSRLLQDPMTREFLGSATRPGMRQFGYYSRLCRLVDAIHGGPLPR